MFENKLRKKMLASFCVLPFICAGQVFAKDSSNSKTDKQVSKLTKAQRSGYLGKVSESVILSGNLDLLKSASSYRNFYSNNRSLKSRVKFWHTVAIDSVALDHTPDPDVEDFSPSQGGPTRTSRALAMVQIAVFDALNSIDSEYQSYTSVPDGFESASEHSAVAYAAYSTLVILYPQQKERLDEILEDEIDRIERFVSTRALEAGKELGELIATSITEARADDGSGISEPNFGEGGAVADGSTTFYGTPVNGGTSLVGEWEPDPNTPEFSGDFNLSLGAYWGNVEPFFLSSGNQFRVPEPPSFDSKKYLKAYRSVAQIGGSTENTDILSTSTNKTRFVANYWGYDGVPLIGVPPRIYNQIVSQIASDNIDDGLEFARVLAMVNVGMADTAIAAWDSKFFYNFWRPVTGIRKDDGVDATTTYENWDPVGVSVVNTTEAIRATPPFPAYPSGHASFGAVTFEILRDMFGNRTSFTFVSDEYNGEGVDPFFPNVPRPFVPVRFKTLTDAQVQNGVSRVYNGVHWEFDDTAGQELGEHIAEFLLEDTEAFSKKRSNKKNQSNR